MDSYISRGWKITFWTWIHTVLSLEENFLFSMLKTNSMTSICWTNTLPLSYSHTCSQIPFSLFICWRASMNGFYIYRDLEVRTPNSAPVSIHIHVFIYFFLVCKYVCNRILPDGSNLFIWVLSFCFHVYIYILCESLVTWYRTTKWYPFHKLKKRFSCKT